MTWLRRRAKGVYIVTLTVVLATAVGALGELPFWETPAWWPLDARGGTAMFYAAVVALGLATGGLLARAFSGVARYDAFERVERVAKCDVVVLPLSVEPSGLEVAIPPGPLDSKALRDIGRQLASSKFEPGWALFVELIESGHRPDVILLDSLPDEGVSGGDGAMALRSLKPVFTAIARDGVITRDTSIHVPRVTLVPIRRPLDLEHCFIALREALAPLRDHDIVIDLNGGTTPMSTACAMLGITKGQVMVYKPRGEERRIYDARIHLVSPFTAVSGS